MMQRCALAEIPNACMGKAYHSGRCAFVSVPVAYVMMSMHLNSSCTCTRLTYSEVPRCEKAFAYEGQNVGEDEVEARKQLIKR
jgi:hypothetical protein